MPVRLTRLADAPPYSPPLHEGVSARRLQGLEAGPTDRFWVGHSVYSPGGGVESSPTAQETVYVLLSGALELTIYDDVGRTPMQMIALQPNDSVHMSKGTVRSLSNRTTADAVLLVAIATPTD